MQRLIIEDYEKQVDFRRFSIFTFLRDCWWLLFYLKISNVLTSFDGITTSDILVDIARIEKYMFYYRIK